MCVQESPAKAWVDGGLLQGWGHGLLAVHAWDLLREITIIFITSTILCPQVNSRGISLRLLQQSAGAAPYLGCGVTPLSQTHCPVASQGRHTETIIIEN